MVRNFRHNIYTIILFDVDFFPPDIYIWIITECFGYGSHECLISNYQYITLIFSRQLFFCECW